MELKPVIIIGAGGLGKVALDIFEENNTTVYCFLDDDKQLHNTEIGEVTVLGATDDDGFLKYIGNKCDAFVAVDDLAYKKSLIDLLKTRRKVMPANAVHKTATISSRSSLGHGNLLAAKTIISTAVEIGHHCVIHANALIDFNTKIGDFVQIGAGSIVNSDVEIGEGAFIGSGVTIVSGIKIGSNARIGAGSVVVKSVGNNETVFGNPAAVIKK